ncbi:MAG: hypothetical protein IJ387_07465, partial [Thermoguttaceae bacterium]|nr:hypothetical protein [Thermoguttaceae bacterium]
LRNGVPLRRSPFIARDVGVGREAQAQETRNGAGLETAPFFIGRRASVERNAEQAPVVGRNAERTPPNEPPGKRTPDVGKPT